MQKDTKAAFLWIVEILRTNNIRFLITGGFAARIYGSKRELADIDIEVADADVLKVAAKVKNFIIYGPKRYHDKQYDLLLMTLKYKGQEIDLSGVDTTMIFDKQKGKWIQDKADLSNATRKRVFNKIVPVISKTTLIAYKNKVRRKVDLDDVAELQ